jgi:hypothetical protein
MKVTGPGSGLPPEGAPEVPEAEATAGKGFAAKLEKPGDVAATGAQETAGAERASSVADIGADLVAGKLTPAAAVDAIVKRIVDEQIGADGPPAVRAKLEAALRDALESDPLLVEQVKKLS